MKLFARVCITGWTAIWDFDRTSMMRLRILVDQSSCCDAWVVRRRRNCVWQHNRWINSSDKIFESFTLLMTRWDCLEGPVAFFIAVEEERKRMGKAHECKVDDILCWSFLTIAGRMALNIVLNDLRWSLMPSPSLPSLCRLQRLRRKVARTREHLAYDSQLRGTIHSWVDK